MTDAAPPSGRRHSYHDLYIETAAIPRTSIFNLPFGLMVTCTRTAGWELWAADRIPQICIAAEYTDDPARGLALDVGGVYLVDSLHPAIVAAQASAGKPKL